MRKVWSIVLLLGLMAALPGFAQVVPDVVTMPS